MNTLHDLRDTLDRHAHDVHDDDAVARVAAVTGRARAVRRRRAAGVGAAAVLAVAAVATVSVLPGDRDPAPSDRELIGREAPETIESLGYTYAFEEGVESGERRATVRLRPADGPRLITWAAEADEVVLDDPYGEQRWSTDTDFDDFVVVDGAESGRWTLRAGGADAALAVYELERQAPGVQVDGMTFREQVGSERLVDVVVGEPSDMDVSMDVTLPVGGIRVVEYCTGIATGARVWINTSVDDKGSTASGGCAEGDFDPAVGSGASFEPGQLGRPGDNVTLRTWVSKRVDGPVLDPIPGVRLGLALYRVGEPAAVVAGWDMPQLKEHGGHLWQFTGTVLGEPGQRRLDVSSGGPRALLAVGSYSRTGRSTVEFRAGPGAGVSRSSVGGGGSDLRAVLEPGAPPARLVVRGDASSQVQLGFATYERVD